MEGESRRRSATRNALVEAAFTLFLRDGFDAVTVADIADHAGVARRTFFRYYPSKEAIVFPYFEDRINIFYDLLMGNEGVRPVSVSHIRNVYLWLCRHWMADADQVSLQGQVISSSETLRKHDAWVMRHWTNCVILALAGLPKDADPMTADPETRIVAGAIVGGIEQAFWACRQSGGKSDLVELGQMAFDTIEIGINAMGSTEAAAEQKNAPA